MPIGRLSINTARQLSSSTSHPPVTGPRAGPMDTGIMGMPTAKLTAAGMTMIPVFIGFRP